MSAHRRISMTLRCPECSGEFNPHHRTQIYCDRSCAAIAVSRRSPARRASMQKAIKVRKEQYAKRLAIELQGMTKAEIWRKAYDRGYSAAWYRIRRRVA